MKTISVSVLSADYAEFRRAARRQHRSIAALIREAMTLYRQTTLDERPRLTQLQPLLGPRPRRKGLPSRGDLYDEIIDDGLCP